MKHSLSVLALFLLPSLAAAGPSSSGGGASIVCRGPDNKIQTARLLDLYEGEIRHGLKIVYSNAHPQTQLQRAFERLESADWYVASDVADALAAVEKNIRFLPAGVIMAPGVDLGDSYAALIPDGCELAYVGYYEQDDTLRISRTIFEKLSNTDRAALFLHEALYKVARDVGREKNSLAARTINALLFSEELQLPHDALASLRWANSPWLNGSDSTRFLSPALVPSAQDEISILVKKFTDPGISRAGGMSVFCITAEGKRSSFYFESEKIAEGRRQSARVPGCRALHVYWGQMSDATAQLEIFYGRNLIGQGQVEDRRQSPDVPYYALTVVIPIYIERKLTIPAWPLF